MIKRLSAAELYPFFKAHPAICTDTRNIVKGCIFFALKGPSFNGNTFAQKAIESGAVYAVVDEETHAQNERCLLVEDALKALQDLAHYHRLQLKIPVLAVTGSNGKTTTKELVRSVLSKKFRTLATRGNLNNHIGVPLTLLSISGDEEFAIIEMGANHQQEIASYCTYAEPDFGLITNVGKAHLEGFGGFEGVMKGKGELYEYIGKKDGVVFINADNVYLDQMALDRKVKHLVRYGTKPGCETVGELVSDRPSLHIKWKSGNSAGEIRSQLIGAYNFENILSAVCIGNYFGVAAEDIDRAIEEYVPDNSRSQVVRRGDNTIILDAYNANPTSMEAALKNFNSLQADQKVVCIGDMAELGPESDSEHRKIVEMVKSAGYDLVILVGKNFGKYRYELPCYHFQDSASAAQWLKDHPVHGRTILLKGSRSTKMEVVLEAI